MSMLSNRSFADTDKSFLNLCKRADTPPTKRQASKFRNHKGKAFKSQARMVARGF
jgi:hypothetical protein